jgi:hypothetical protein
MRIAILTALAAALVACSPYDPDLGGRPFKCGTSDPVCPDGYACVGTGSAAVCEQTGAADAHMSIDSSHVQCGTDTSLEPNDDIGHALQTPVRMQQADYMLAKLAICPSTDIDMYAIYTTAIGQQVRITLTYDPSQGQLNMKLLTSQGADAGFVGQPSGNQIIIATNRLSVDRFFVQVSAATNVENNYDIDFNVSP